MPSETALRRKPLQLQLRFDAATHPVATERVAAWRDAMSLSVDAVFEPDEIEGFEGRLDFHPLGTVLLVDASTTPHVMVRDRSTIARSGDAHVILDAIPTGAILGVAGNRPLTAGPGDCFLLDLRGRLRVRIETTRLIGAIIPRTMLEAQVGSARSIHGLRFAARTTEARLLCGLLETLSEQAPHLKPQRASALGDALVAWIAACLRERSGRSAKPFSPPPKPDFVRIRRHIERHASDPSLDPQRLCMVFGLSRTALYRMFEPEDGVAEVIRRARTALARRRLGNARHAGEPIDAIARASGFTDTRTMRRALRDLHDTTPSQLRRGALGAAAPGEPHHVEIGALIDATERQGEAP